MDNASNIIYGELVEGSLYTDIFNNYLWEFIQRKNAITDVRLFMIANQEKLDKFRQVVEQKEKVLVDPPDSKQVDVVSYFHGSEFQQDNCQFNVDTGNCTGHQNNIVCLTNNILYSYQNQGKRNRYTKIQYAILCQIVIGNRKIRDPEDTQLVSDYFDQGYDTVIDYGNKKVFKVMSDEVLPLYLIAYRRKYNSRLDNPLNQLYEAENIVPAPEVRYEDLDHNSLEFIQLGCNLSQENILSVTKIINPYLERKYKEIKEEHYPNAKDLQVFHGTTFECADLIAKYNLDWRKCAYGKYGWGVHFAEYAGYAAYFPLKNCHESLEFDGPKKCMIVFKMLHDEHKLYYVAMEEVSRKLSGMELPPTGFNGVHIEYKKHVKFNDFEFMPVYKIIYEKKQVF